jgi:hypothetical protein
MYVESIIEECVVIPIEEYEQLTSIENNIYFTRSVYDIDAKTLTPEIREWRTLCECNMPQNPNMMYIQCDKCDSWYHPKCARTTEEVVNKLPEWFCYKCI